MEDRIETTPSVLPGITAEMTAAGRQIVNDLMDANISHSMGGLGGSSTWDEWLAGYTGNHLDLIKLYVEGKICSAEAIYEAMRRVAPKEK